MAELKANIDDAYSQMLHSLKPVAETIIEEEVDFDSYVNMVRRRGIRGIIEDMMSSDPGILMKSILMMYETNPEFVASFITNTLKAGATREDARDRLGFIKDA